jgi:hypothetical protein
MSEKITYPKKTIDGRIHMICQNSVPYGEWWRGKICKEWVQCSKDSIAVLCSYCVAKTLTIESLDSEK